MSIWRSVVDRVARANRAAADLLIPATCLLCGVAAETHICAACHAALPWMPDARCRICAEPLPAAGTGAACGRCLKRPPAFDATVAVWAYAFPVDAVIHAMKYAHRLSAAAMLGSLVAEAAPAALAADRVVAVPLSPARLADRGFNQSVELARPLARRLGKPIDGGLTRTRDTPPQAGLPLLRRVRNLRRSFAYAGRLDGAHVVVVDDVMTTGATLDEVARTLKAAGAFRVTNIVAARALRDAAGQARTA